MSDQSQGELYPRELEDAFKLCRIANATLSQDGYISHNSLRYLVDCRVHEPIGPDNPIRIEDFDADESISVKELEDRLGEVTLTRNFYKQSVRNA